MRVAAGWPAGRGRGSIPAMTREEVAAQLAAIEVEVAHAHGLDLSAASPARALRMYLVELEKTEETIEAKITVHGASFQALLVGLGGRYGVPVYRRPRQRGTTLMLRGPRTFVHQVIGVMFQQMSNAFDAWFLDETQELLQRLQKIHPR